jgi:predicted Fe-Mo cluster-binding NifX family protein
MSLPIPPKLAAPAKRALAEASITSLEQLQTKLEAEILAMHGMGPNAMKILRQAMADADVHFKPVS